MNGFAKEDTATSNSEGSASSLAATKIPANGETTSMKASSLPSLNPAAPAFQPRSPPPATTSPPPPSSAPKEDFPALSNGHANGHASPPPVVAPSSPNGGMADSHADEASLAQVGKSWAEIVREDSAPSAENGTNAVDVGETSQHSTSDELAETAGSSATGSLPEETAAAPPSEVAVERDEQVSPIKSKAELWYEIKTLCTSLPPRLFR